MVPNCLRIPAMMHGGDFPEHFPEPELCEGTVTRILKRFDAGEDGALGEAILVVYEDLRRIGARHLRSERRTPTFDTESLVHEVYLQLVKQDRTHWQNRHHLFAVAARMMRRTLVDRARSRLVAKRGAGARPTTLDDEELVSGSRRLEVTALDDALVDLETYDPTLAQLVELRFFGGMTNDEIGAVQGVTSMTVIRRWRLAKAWLHRYLRATP